MYVLESELQLRSSMEEKTRNGSGEEGPAGSRGEVSVIGTRQGRLERRVRRKSCQ